MIARTFQGCCCVPLALGFITDSRIVRKHALSMLVLHIFFASCLQTPIHTHTHTQANSVYPNYTLCEASASLSLQGNNNIGDSASGLPPGQNAPLIHKTQKKHSSFQHPRHASKKIIPSDPKSKRKIITTDPHNPHPNSHTHTHKHNQQTKQTKQKKRPLAEPTTFDRHWIPKPNPPPPKKKCCLCWCEIATNRERYVLSIEQFFQSY